VVAQPYRPTDVRGTLPHPWHSGVLLAIRQSKLGGRALDRRHGGWQFVCSWLARER
jgi:hypothetical protein